MNANTRFARRIGAGAPESTQLDLAVVDHPNMAMRTTQPVSAWGRATWPRLAALAVVVAALATAPEASAASTEAATLPPGVAKSAPKRGPITAKPRRLPNPPNCASPEAADDLDAPEALQRRARCDELDGRLLAALELYETALRHQPTPALARQLRAGIGALVPRLGAVRVDASAWPRGTHVRVGTRTGEAGGTGPSGGVRQWVDPRSRRGRSGVPWLRAGHADRRHRGR